MFIINHLYQFIPIIDHTCKTFKIIDHTSLNKLISYHAFKKCLVIDLTFLFFKKSYLLIYLAKSVQLLITFPSEKLIIDHTCKKCSVIDLTGCISVRGKLPI